MLQEKLNYIKIFNQFKYLVLILKIYLINNNKNKINNYHI